MKKPPRIEVRPQSIPQELKDKNQWVVWSWESRDGKWTKPPYNPMTGKPASVSNPEDWVDFSTALYGVKYGDWDGIGFVLSGDYVGVDFDNIVLDDGEIKEPAKTQIFRLNSYTEISPSGRGVKVLIKATLPKNGHHKNGVGVFNDRRYFCLTGQRIEGVSPRIEERQQEVLALLREIAAEDFQDEGPRIDIKATSPTEWNRLITLISSKPKIMKHWLTPKHDDRSGHDWRLTLLCIEEGITDPSDLAAIILNNPHGKARSYPDTEKYIRDLLSRALSLVPQEQERSTLKLPPSVFSGVCGEFAETFAKYVEVPKEFFFFSLLTSVGSSLAGKLTLRSELRPEPRFYILLLGESGDDRKSTALRLILNFLTEFFPGQFNACHGVGSAEGLQARLNEVPGGRLLLVLDEFKAFVQKAKIDGSVLLPCVNTLFESNRYESRTKGSDIKLEDVHLSLLAASTTQTYETIWSQQFISIGLPNRLFLVPGKALKGHPMPQKIPFHEKRRLADNIARMINLVGDFLEMDLNNDALVLWSEWYHRLERSEHTKRLDTYGLRLMPLLALNEGETTVTRPIVEKVIEILDWQKGVREQLDPIDADNSIAIMEEKIRRVLKRGPLGLRELQKRTNAHRVGSFIFNKALSNLSSGRLPEVRYIPANKTWEIVTF